MVLSVLVGATLMDVSPVEPFAYRQGQFIPDDIHARVKFQVLSPNRLEKLILATNSRMPATFKIDPTQVGRIADSIKALPGHLKATTQPKEVNEDLLKRFALKREDLKAWSAYGSPQDAKRLDDQLAKLRAMLFVTCIVADVQANAQLVRAASKIKLSHGNEVSEISKSGLISLTQAGRIRNAAEDLAESFDVPVRRNVTEYLKSQLAAGAMYSLDKSATDASIVAAEHAMRNHPPEDAYERYKSGQLLAKARVPGKRAMSQGDLDVLQHEHAAWVQSRSAARSWAMGVGRAVVILMIVAMLCIYICRYQARILSKHWRGLALAISLLVLLACSKAMVSSGGHPYSAVGVVLMLTLIMTITYDQRFAMTMGTILSVLVTLQFRGDIPMLIVLLSSVIVCAFLLHEVRTRSKVLEISFVCAVVVFAVVLAKALAQSIPWTFALTSGGWGAGCAIAAGLVVQGLLPIIERAFGIATSMTLLEWCDANKALLKRLAMSAPGTYNHSLQLGAMCETAAEEIGARGLLARVGAYYHDIGKINKPPYFAENQRDGNKHDKLSPAMSMLIITGHVKDGMEMAREYNLPRVLHQFIQTHHGTTLVQYFYQAATKQSQEEQTKTPDEIEFRYAGPKPSSKEAAILLLADACESSVRAMNSTTPGRIESQVHTMVMRRLMDGQLDECELTLQEVHRIETSLVKSLCGIYHARLAYPSPEGEQPAASEIASEEFIANGHNQCQAKPANAPDVEVSARPSQTGGETGKE